MILILCSYDLMAQDFKALLTSYDINAKIKHDIKESEIEFKGSKTYSIRVLEDLAHFFTSS